MGEIYLNYAEAMFELGDEATCKQYLNLIRPRLGMPGIPASVSGEKLRARLYNERRIELAFKEHRYWEVRLWWIASEVENRPIEGMEIIKDVATDVNTYTPVVLLERTFTEQMYLLPILTDEISKNKGSLLQSVTWR